MIKLRHGKLFIKSSMARFSKLFAIKKSFDGGYSLQRRICVF